MWNIRCWQSLNLWDIITYKLWECAKCIPITYKLLYPINSSFVNIWYFTYLLISFYPHFFHFLASIASKLRSTILFSKIFAKKLKIFFKRPQNSLENHGNYLPKPVKNGSQPFPYCDFPCCRPHKKPCGVSDPDISPADAEAQIQPDPECPGKEQ